MQAAEKLFTSRRFHQITMDDIAEVAAVAKGTLYGYFQDKEDLFFQTTTSGFEELCALIARNVPGEGPFPERLLGVCRQITGFFEGRHQLFRLMQAEDMRMAYSTGRLHDRWMAERRQLVAAVAGILRQGIGGGLLRRDLPTNVLANLLLGMLRTKVRDLADAPARARRHETIVDFFCHGASCRDGAGRSRPGNRTRLKRSGV